MSNLESRYDSQSTASLIAKMSELVRTRFSSFNHKFSAHVDKLSELIKKLRSVGTSFEDSVEIVIIVSSTEMVEFFQVTASIKNLSE